MTDQTDGADAPIQSFDDVGDEYQALRNQCGLVESRWETVWVEGPDAIPFVQGLISADVETMPEQGVARSFFLTPRGMIRWVMWVLKGPESLGLICNRGEGSEVAEFLDYYRIRVKAVVRHDDPPVSALVGPGCRKLGAPEEGRWESQGDHWLAAAALAGLPRLFFVGDPPASVPPVGELAWQAVRVESGEPIAARDLDQRTIPQETGALAEAAISFTKGCYLGQELVARIDSRGRVNRTLRGLAGNAEQVPPERAQVYRADKVVGTITSVTKSPSSGSFIGLSLVRRGADPGQEVQIRWDGRAATALVHSIPMVNHSTTTDQTMAGGSSR